MNSKAFIRWYKNDEDKRADKLNYLSELKKIKGLKWIIKYDLRKGKGCKVDLQSQYDRYNIK